MHSQMEPTKLPGAISAVSAIWEAPATVWLGPLHNDSDEVQQIHFLRSARRQILLTDRWTAGNPIQPVGVIVSLQFDRNRVRLWIIR